MKHRVRPQPAGRGLTYAGSAGHDAYPLPALPPGFCWAHAELFAPGMVCQRFLDAQDQLGRLEP